MKNAITIQPCANGFIVTFPTHESNVVPIDIGPMLDALKKFKSEITEDAETDPLLKKIYAEMSRDQKAKMEMPKKIIITPNIFIFTTFAGVLKFLSGEFPE